MVHKSLGTGRLFGKFMLLLLPVFAIATAAGLLFVSQFFMRDEQNALNARVGNLVARVSSIIATQSPDTGARQLEAYLGILMADPAMRCAELSDTSGNVFAASPRRIGCKGQDGYDRLVLRLPNGSESVLTIRYANHEVAAIREDKRLFTQLALLIGLLVAGLASWIGFRLFIGRPIGSLLAAIQTSAATGAATTVDAPPKDELGAVIGAFNAMQMKLQEEATRNLVALGRLDHLYNETPALLFSISPCGQITSVSGHWLEKTGYAREEIIGKSLLGLLASPDPADAAALPAIANEPLNEFACLVRCRDGSMLDVLLSSIPSRREDGGGKDFLCVMTDISGLVAARRSLHEQIVTDHLTKLPNRQALFEHLANLSKGSGAALQESAVLFIDLDNFKWVNDTHGHDAGDDLLLAAAARLKNCVAAGDFLARLGGDEFAIVLHGRKGECDAAKIANRIIAQLSLPFQIAGATAFVGCSVGIADSGADVQSPEHLLRLADLAMYKSKQDGRNRATPYSAELGQRAIDRTKMLSRIRTALSHQHFRLYCQPIVDLTNMQPTGAEGLLRLLSPSEGIIGPADVIRTAEETGMMGAIGRWVLEEGFAISTRWRRSGNARYLSINLSPRQIEPAFMALLVERLRANPDTAGNLVFEITESSLLNNAERITQFFADVRSAGARISLDDFGTGYSSLHYISRFPVDFVKLDRSFVRHIDDQTATVARRNQALIRSTAALCHDLDIAVVAEGVETMAELEILRGMGIRYCQGYLFSRPLPEGAFADWVSHFTARPEVPPALPLAS